MEPLAKFRQTMPFMVSMLFLVLFMYAASNKVIDYRQFQQQLELSGFLKGNATALAWMVPAIEIVVSVFLLIPRFRVLGLYGSLGLLLWFTGYILWVLHFSDIVPCSCGGVISALGWRGHLYFNLCLLALAFLGIFLSTSKKGLSDKNTT